MAAYGGRTSETGEAGWAGVSAGVDLVSVPRIEGMVRRWGDRFLKRVYTGGEIAYCLSRAYPARSLAARFAAKEAFFKSVSGWHRGGLSHRSIEVVTTSAGAPAIRPHGKARKALGDRLACLSLSHEQDLAVAVVVTSGPMRGRAGRKAGSRPMGRRRLP
jgi:holo-[acyl-carrier protein] synthase